MNVKDVVKIIQSSECAQIATFGKDETEGFPEIRALLNLANQKKYPKLKGKAISDSASTAQAFRANRTNYTNCNKAAKATEGLVLLYNNAPISAVYCDSNGGRTYSSEEVWGGVKPYLIARADSWDTTGVKKGHGVGLSQKGAINAANKGKTYKEILKFYYPNTKIEYYVPILVAQIRTIINDILSTI